MAAASSGPPTSLRASGSRTFGRSAVEGPARLLALAALLFSLSASAASITRGPYLQLGSQSGMTVVFQTDVASVGRVRFGTSATSLTRDVVDSAAGTTHVLALNGLTASTRYYYQVELDGQPQLSGLTFRTYPTPGVHEPFRFFAWGDSGTASSGQFAVANRMNGEPGEPAFALILGDIIYPAGDPQDYDPKYFAPYRPMLQRMVVWPTIGNHDVGSTLKEQPYLDAFYLPTNNPAASELYYSFDYGDVHFVCLDTHTSWWTDSTKRGQQLAWAQSDLQASTARWKFVFFHRPPYSGGTHLDDAEIKSLLVPLVEAQNVDIVFAGHSHVYERTYLLQNNAIFQSDPASYTKFSGAAGTLYVVSGTAGQSGALQNAAHPLMAFQKGNTLGNSVIDVSGPTVRGYFLDKDGNAVDLFTLSKDIDTEAPRVIGVKPGPLNTQVAITFNEPVAAGAATGSAENPSRYTITPAVGVVSATLRSDLRTVSLTTQPHAVGDYSMAISGVVDRANPANTVAAGTQVLYRFETADAGSPDAGAPDAGPGGYAWVLSDEGASWSYRLGTSAPPAGWTELAADDSAWPTGNAPLGYGEPTIATSVPMSDAGTVTFYARRHFNVPGKSTGLESLSLLMNYDDGFVAYLNGAEVARRLVPANQTNTTTASGGHELGLFETFDVTAHASRLVTGDNLLAVEIHNVGLSSSDAYLDAELGSTVKPLPAYVSSVSPAAGASSVAASTAVGFRLQDDTLGVDPASVQLLVNGLQSDVQLTGNANDWSGSFTPPVAFSAGQGVTVEVRATNRQGIAMEPYSWSFQIAAAGSDGGTSGDGGTTGDGGGGGPDANRPCGCDGTGGALTLFALLGLGLLRRKRLAGGVARE